MHWYTVMYQLSKHIGSVDVFHRIRILGKLWMVCMLVVGTLRYWITSLILTISHLGVSCQTHFTFCFQPVQFCEGVFSQRCISI